MHRGGFHLLTNYHNLVVVFLLFQTNDVKQFSIKILIQGIAIIEERQFQKMRVAESLI